MAVLPHFLDKVPAPMETRGKAKLEEESEEGFYNLTTDLCERSESQISRMAWNDTEHKIPLMTLKWLSPNHERFSSRKSAEEEAEKLAEQQLFVDKIVFGYGARGQKLQPRKPTKQEALKAGKWRFLRDGIWVVGQEESWQKDRSIEMALEIKRRKLESAEKVTQPKPAPCVPKSAVQLFVKTQRNAYREAMLEKSLTTLDNSQFTLTDADRELRDIWKRNMTKEERQIWKDILEGKASCGSSKPISSDDDDIETPEQNPIDVNVGIEENPEAKALDPKEQDLHKLESDASNPITGIEREQYGGSMHGDVATTVQEGTQRTADSLSTNLGQRWSQLDSVAKKEWEENAASECVECAKTIVVSPGDSDEEMDKNTSEGRCSKKAKMCLNEPGSFAAQSAGNENLTEETSLAGGNAGEDNKIDVPVASKASQELPQKVRRSGRPQKVRRIFEVEIQRRPEKKKAAYAPSVWAIPVVQGKEVDLQIGEQIKAPTEEALVFEVTRSKATAAPKRKRAECPDLQITRTEHWRLSQEQILMCYDAAMEHFDRVMYTVKAKALFAELSDGFDVLRERGRGRYDMELPAFDDARFQFLTDFAKTPWMGVVRQILGEDVVLIHKGVFLSNPGADAQVYHQDGPHLTTQYQRSCHAINVFVPLVDLSLRNGPTEFVVGSHILDYDDYDKSKVVTPQVAAGTPIIFDYRLGHRGLANTSDTSRPVVYCTYAASSNGKEFRDSVNFSRKRYRRLGEMVEKPLSREERCRKREATQEERGGVKAVEVIDANSVGSIPLERSEASHEEVDGLESIEEKDAPTVEFKPPEAREGAQEEPDRLRLFEGIVAATMGYNASTTTATHFLSPFSSGDQ